MQVVHEFRNAFIDEKDKEMSLDVKENRGVICILDDALEFYALPALARLVRWTMNELVVKYCAQEGISQDDMLSRGLDLSSPALNVFLRKHTTDSTKGKPCSMNFELLAKCPPRLPRSCSICD